MAAPFSSLRPARVFAVLGAATSVLVELSVLGQSLLFGLGHGRLLGFIDGFDVDAETNIPTFFASAQLLLAAGLTGLVAVAAWRSRDRFRRDWAGLSLLLCGFAIDGFVQLHEQLATLPFLPAKSGVLLYAWVLPGIVLVGFFGMAYARFFWALPARWKGLFGAAAAVFFGAGRDAGTRPRPDRRALSREGEVALVVGRAAGIEGRAAVGTRVVAPQVGVGTHRGAAGPAQHGRLVAPGRRPAGRLVTGDGAVAAGARVVDLAAREADRNHVAGAVVVRAPSGRVDPHAPEGNRKAIVGRRGLCGSSIGDGHGREGERIAE